jgi:hypothetical protein
MKTALNPMPKLPQKVCWRNPQQAREWGWEQLLGTGPFEVVRIVDSYDGLAAGLIVKTSLGERENP